MSSRHRNCQPNGKHCQIQVSKSHPITLGASSLDYLQSVIVSIFNTELSNGVSRSITSPVIFPPALVLHP